jgi:hypothetical protein
MKAGASIPKALTTLPGETYFGADVKGCADRTRLSLNLWEASDARGNVFGINFATTVSSPPLPAVASVGKCVSGWIVFAIPKGDQIARVNYLPDRFNRYQWKVG